MSHLKSPIASPSPPPHPLCRVVDCCTHWYELMAARLLFTSPLVISGDYDLVYAAEVSLWTRLI